MHEKELDGCIKTWFFTRVRSICWILPFNEQSQAHGLGTHMGWGTLFMGRHWERGGCLFPYSPFPILILCGNQQFHGLKFLDLWICWRQPRVKCHTLSPHKAWRLYLCVDIFYDPTPFLYGTSYIHALKNPWTTLENFNPSSLGFGGILEFKRQTNNLVEMLFTMMILFHSHWVWYKLSLFF